MTLKCRYLFFLQNTIQRHVVQVNRDALQDHHGPGYFYFSTPPFLTHSFCPLGYKRVAALTDTTRTAVKIGWVFDVKL